MHRKKDKNSQKYLAHWESIKCFGITDSASELYFLTNKKIDNCLKNKTLLAGAGQPLLMLYVYFLAA